ncbi:MAG TPA: DUF4468 domain-containing protein [Flavobacterium sp.]|jgi:hypothetical protein
MKRLLLAVVIFCTALTAKAQAPAKFELTPQGFTDFIVTEVPGKSKAELYKSTLDWIQVTFNGADAIKAKAEGEKVTFEGKGKFVSIDGALKLTYDSRFQMEISFKDGKYKADLLKVEYYTERNANGPGGWRDVQLTDVAVYFTKQGTLRAANKYFPEITDHLNKLNDELKRFIESGATVTAKKSDW